MFATRKNTGFLNESLAFDMKYDTQLECWVSIHVNRSIHQGQFAYAEKETQHGSFSVSKLADQSSEGPARGWRGVGITVARLHAAAAGR